MPTRNRLIMALPFLTVPLLLAGPAPAQTLETAAQLHAACKIYASEGAKTTQAARNPQDPCRRFLAGYLAAFKTQYDQGQAPVCVRMPDTLTYVEFAERITAFGDASPQPLQGTATALAQETLARNFPCADKPR